MLVRERYPAGVPCWIDITPPEPEAATEFYGGVFGWQFEDRTPSGTADRYWFARLGGQTVAGIGSAPPGSIGPPAWSTCIAVEDVDEAAKRVSEAAGSVLVEPIEVPGAGRMAVCADRAGARFTVWQAAGHAGAQLVNAQGTWNWSNLETRDPDGSRAFYESVFGWQARTVDLGAGQTTMWCLPGYGDFLAAIDPDLRRRHAEEGVPEGFSDIVAWMSATEDVPSAWNVTFAADDTDAVVDRAATLGGRVVVPPYDAGPARVAVLADPQGATFTVSRYQPE